MPIISSTVTTFVDRGGTPRTEGHLLLEFDDASYQPGGEIFDLSSLFRRIEYMHLQAASGALYYMPMNPGVDTPGGPISTRIQLTRSGGSGLVFSEVASGTAVSGTRAWAYVVGS